MDANILRSLVQDAELNLSLSKFVKAGFTKITYLRDRGYTFNEIADAINDHPKPIEKCVLDGKLIEFTRLEINPDSLKRTYNRAEKKLDPIMSEEECCLPLRKVFAALKMSGFLISHDGDASTFDQDVERFMSLANLSQAHVEGIKSDIEAMMRPNRKPEAPA